MTQLTQQYLKNRYDYNPKTDEFIYKPNTFKGACWNKTFSGNVAKPLCSNGNKYLMVNNALYRIDQLIALYQEGDEVKVYPTKVETLIKKEEELKGLFSKLSIEELLYLRKSDFTGLTSREIIASILQSNPIKDNKKRVSIKKEISKARSIFYADKLEVNPNSGYPYHIYYDENEQTFFIKIVYERNIHSYYGIKNLEEAFLVRRLIYTELIEAEERGEDMSIYNCTIDYEGLITNLAKIGK